jgi:hypothetical protein
MYNDQNYVLDGKIVGSAWGATIACKFFPMRYTQDRLSDMATRITTRRIVAEARWSVSMAVLSLLCLSPLQTLPCRVNSFVSSPKGTVLCMVSISTRWTDTYELLGSTRSTLRDKQWRNYLGYLAHGSRSLSPTCRRPTTIYRIVCGFTYLRTNSQHPHPVNVGPTHKLCSCLS